MKLGIFDSGIGGEAVARSLRKAFPEASIRVVNDHKNVPYGSKTPGEVVTLTDRAIQPLLQDDCDIIILACNTASAAAIETLRQWYPNQKFIGLEPMVKTAASLTKNGTVAICATPATLASDRYMRLVTKYGAHLTILEPDCSTWAYMIENDHINREEIKRIIDDVCSRGADVIVLGCTHYHWIKDLVSELALDRATVIEPSEAIARRVASLLAIAA